MNPEFFDNQIIFKAPFTCLLAGPSQCGKSSLLFNILEAREQLIDRSPTRIVYCYAVWQENFGLLNNINIEFRQGLPSMDDFYSSDNNLVILDDLMSECEKNKEIQELFTVHSHHKNISVFIISQNLFSRGPCARTISLNCRYIIVFNNPRDAVQIRRLGQQMFPEKSNFLAQAYKDAIDSSPYGYLFIDNTQSTPSKYRISTNILPSDTRIYYRFK